MAENSASAACERLAPATVGVAVVPAPPPPPPPPDDAPVVLPAFPPPVPAPVVEPPGAGAGVPAVTVKVAACTMLAALVSPTALRLATTELCRLAVFTLGCVLPAIVKIAFTPVLESRRWL